MPVEKKDSVAEDTGTLALVGPEIEGTRHFLKCEEGCITGGGSLQRAPEGVPLGEGAITLEHQTGDLYLMKSVDTLKGPAKVATPAYRNGWDSVFGKRVVGQA